MANALESDPQPNLLTDSVSRLFWGVQLRCAECHDHPFAPWTQEDFWSTAAFFSRLRRGYTEGKDARGQTLTEAPPDEPLSKASRKSMAAPGVPGPAILVPSTARDSAGKVIKGRFLGSSGPAWTDEGPYLPRFAEWATSPAHPYFARNAANRLWAHLFGHGLVDPPDGLDPSHAGSHPEILDLLSKEFVSSDYDLKHLVRVLCATRAYQRTSRPARGNESSGPLFARMSVKVQRAEMLYDSLSMVLYPVLGKPFRAASDPLLPLPGLSRAEFVRRFRSRGSTGEAGAVNLGIAQILRLMNGDLVRSDAPGLRRWAGLPAPEAIEGMVLAAYGRRPTPDEAKLLSASLAAEADPERGYAGILWTLLNSAEFLLNH